MRDYVRSASLVLLLMLAVPQPARADWMAFLDYLDNLSGPGPFIGLGFDVPLRCREDSGVTWRCFWPVDQVDEDTLGDLHLHRWEIGPRVSFLRGRINDDLIYPPGTTDDEKRVNVFTYGMHANANFTRRWGATLRFSNYRFSGTLVRNGSLTRSTVALGPVVGFSPRALRNVSIRRVTVSGLAVVGLGQFRPDDFGMLGPPLDSDNVKLSTTVALYF
jgi:hypothetical protein